MVDGAAVAVDVEDGEDRFAGAVNCQSAAAAVECGVMAPMGRAGDGGDGREPSRDHLQLRGEAMEPRTAARKRSKVHPRCCKYCGWGNERIAVDIVRILRN